MWPPSLKRAIKKIRQYTKNKKTVEEEDDEPTLPSMTPNSFYECEARVQELIERGPLDQFSSPSKRRYTDDLRSTKSHLAKAHLISHEHCNLQTKREITFFHIRHLLKH